MAKKKIKKKKAKLKKLAHIHLSLTAGLFLFYLIASLIFSPDFFLKDIRQKFSALAAEIVLTAKVLGPPVKPVVTAQVQCTNGSLSVILRWPADENSQTFDIDRDGSPLITGRVRNRFRDRVVELGKTYEYQVTARGEMFPGLAISEPISVEMPIECIMNVPVYGIAVLTLDNKSVEVYVGTPEISNTKPKFSGIVNLANAKVDLVLNSSLPIYATVYANENGYWEWTVPVDIEVTTHRLLATAIDPIDDSVVAATLFNFEVVNVPVAPPVPGGTNDDDNDDNHHERNGNVAIPISRVSGKPGGTIIPNTGSQGEENVFGENPVQFSLTLSPKEVYQGKKVQTEINLQKVAENYRGEKVNIRYTILDERGNEVENFVEAETLREGKNISREIKIPGYFKGNYRVRAEIFSKRFTVSQEQKMTVLPLPVLKLGGGVVITYAEILSRIGTISLWSLILFIIWTIIFLREYWMQLHAIRHATEKTLEKLGMFGLRKRKGVAR